MIAQMELLCFYSFFILFIRYSKIIIVYCYYRMKV